jgi:mRNA interferase MazF
MSQILKGEIYWANLSPVGSEISKTRPVLIVSNDINNKYAATVSILPITSTISKVYPFEVILHKGEGNHANDSKAKANQIRTIDKQRIGKRL